MFLSILAPKVCLFLSHKLNSSLTPALYVYWEPASRSCPQWLVFARRASAWGRESGLYVSWRPCGGPEMYRPFPQGAQILTGKQRSVRRGACAVTYNGGGEATSAQTVREHLSEEGHLRGDANGRRRQKEGGGGGCSRSAAARGLEPAGPGGLGCRVWNLGGSRTLTSMRHSNWIFLRS